MVTRGDCGTRDRLPALALLIASLSYALLLGPAAGRSALERGADAVAHRAGKRVASDRRLPHAVVSRTGLRAGEPTLGLVGDGRLFYVAFHDSLRVEVLRSADDGRSWKAVSPRFSDDVNRQLLSLDPYVYVDETTDRVFTIDLTVACSYLSFTDDGGRSWTTNPLACGRPINDHQTLFAGPAVESATQGYRNLLYYCWNDVATSSCSKSLDGGLTFAPTGTPAFLGTDLGGDTPRFCGGLHGHGVVGDDGTVYLPREYCGRPFLAISRDEGATWDHVQVARNGARFTDPSVGVDAKENIYYAWVAKNGLPYLSVSRDRGRTWSRPVMIASPGVREVNLLSVDVGDPGRVAFSHMGTRDPKHPKTWDGFIGMTTNALSERPLLYTAAVNRVADPLKRGACGPGRCGEVVLDFLDVVIGPDGTPWASFVDACNESCVRSGLEAGNEGLAAHLVGGAPLR